MFGSSSTKSTFVCALSMAGQEKKASNSASQTGQLVCAQVEYYFSDENLHRDKFFCDLIARDSAGWVSLAPIMQCNKIKAFNISEDEVLEAVQASEWLEIKNRHVRRRIPFEPRNSQKEKAEKGQIPKERAKVAKAAREIPRTWLGQLLLWTPLALVDTLWLATATMETLA